MEVRKMTNRIGNLLRGAGRMALVVAAFGIFTLVVPNAFSQTKNKIVNAFSTSDKTHQQPLYSDYKGVRIGMTEQEVHAKLGQGVQVDNSEFYMISDSETAQIAYDANRKVTAISVDYTGGVGAPDYKSVVGPDIETRADGSLYKIIHYDELGFWVSYNRTGRNNPVMTVSITIQKVLH
jgi:hypothetical protein